MRTYREMFRIPGVLALLISATFPRLSYSMVDLAAFFHIQHATGSVGTAGIALGVGGLFGSLSAAPRGQLVDRFGQTVPILILAPLYAAACVLLGSFASSAASAILLSAIRGTVAPPINMSIRPLWRNVVGEERVRTAYGLDSAHMNIMQLLGPVLSTLIALHIGTAQAIDAVAAFMLIGGVALALNPHSKSWVPEPRVMGEPSVLRSPAMRLLALEGASMGMAMGFIMIGIPALATLAGDRAQAGPLMSAIGVGSIVGTVWAGAKAKNVAPLLGLRNSVLACAVALIPLAWVPIGPWLMIQITVAFAMMGPAQVFYLETIDIVRPRGTAVSSLGTLWTIEGSASALASALGGNVAEWFSPHVTLLLGSICVFASPVIFTVGMRTVLRPALHKASPITSVEPSD
ncbi:MAG: MFS transporter [Candidatus Nanopelagicales bacterium]